MKIEDYLSVTIWDRLCEYNEFGIIDNDVDDIWRRYRYHNAYLEQIAEELGYEFMDTEVLTYFTVRDWLNMHYELHWRSIHNARQRQRAHFRNAVWEELMQRVWSPARMAIWATYEVD